MSESQGRGESSSGPEAVSASTGRGAFPCSGYKLVPLIPARLIPQGKFDPVPKSELVIDHTEIILHHVFRGADGVRYLVVLQALGYKLDDAVFALTGRTGSITVV